MTAMVRAANLLKTPRLIHILLAVCASVAPTVADLTTNPPPLKYQCRPAATPLVIDGKLTEPAWQQAAWTADFGDIEGPVKPAPRHRTRAKMTWDKDYFFDPNGSLIWLWLFRWQWVSPFGTTRPPLG